MKRPLATLPGQRLFAILVAIATIVSGAALVPNAFAAQQPTNGAAVAKATSDHNWAGVTEDVGYQKCFTVLGHPPAAAKINSVQALSRQPTDEEIDNAVHPGRNDAIFWTGWTDHNGERIRAVCPAEQIVAPRVEDGHGGHGTTLEMALSHGNVPMPGPEDRSLNAERLWTRASRAFANRAAGVVRVVRGPHTRPDNVWDAHEYPLLTRNGTRVTRILQYDMRADGTLTPPRTIWRSVASIICGIICKSKKADMNTGMTAKTTPFSSALAPRLA